MQASTYKKTRILRFALRPGPPPGGPTLPLELVQAKAVLNFPKGRICFDWNLDGCKNAGPGGKCPKGWHVCCHPSCNYAEDHGLRNCPHK